MTTPRTAHVKLGVLAIVGLAAIGALAFVLGIRELRHETVTYHTYFDESVQGLDLGAPVKYRGVRVGVVESISIAPDRTRVDVALALDTTAIASLDLSPGNGMRTRLGTQGITGVKYLDLDVVAPSPPLPPLGFVPDPNYIPARPSLFKGIEDRFVSIGDRIPDLIDRTMVVLDRLDRVLADVHAAKLPARIADVLASVDTAIAEARRLVRDLGAARLPARAGASLARLDAVLAKLDAAAAGLTGNDGLVAKANRATTAVRDAATSLGATGRDASSSTRQLDRTLRDLGDAARAIRELVEQIERDPDMLVKGRARSRKP